LVIAQGGVVPPEARETYAVETKAPRSNYKKKSGNGVKKKKEIKQGDLILRGPPRDKQGLEFRKVDGGKGSR